MAMSPCEGRVFVFRFASVWIHGFVSMSTAESFAQTCTTIFDKMLNTVPSTVTLTDEINLQSVKVSNVQLTVADTELQFQASVRLQLSSNTTNVKMYWCDRYGRAAD